MNKIILCVAKTLMVLAIFVILYVFFFGTSDFAVLDDTGMNFDGAVASVINGMERPMAVYYEEYTFKPNQMQMSNINSSIVSNMGSSVKSVIYKP